MTTKKTVKKATKKTVKKSNAKAITKALGGSDAQIRKAEYIQNIEAISEFAVNKIYNNSMSLELSKNRLSQGIDATVELIKSKHRKSEITVDLVMDIARNYCFKAFVYSLQLACLNKDSKIETAMIVCLYTALDDPKQVEKMTSYANCDSRKKAYADANKGKGFLFGMLGKFKKYITDQNSDFVMPSATRFKGALIKHLDLTAEYEASKRSRKSSAKAGKSSAKVKVNTIASVDEIEKSIEFGTNELTLLIENVIKGVTRINKKILGDLQKKQITELMENAKLVYTK